MFDINPRIPDELYCRKKECLRARKNAWQRNKMATDEDYRNNQAAACRQWQAKNREYWKKYRKRNQAYTLKNREQQRQRNRSRTVAQGSDRSILTPIAKMDALMLIWRPNTQIPHDGQKWRSICFAVRISNCKNTACKFKIKKVYMCTILVS